MLPKLSLMDSPLLPPIPDW